MKLRASQIERMLAKVEATLALPPREWLQVIIDDGELRRRRRRRRWPSTWAAILKMSAARLRTSNGYCM